MSFSAPIIPLRIGNNGAFAHVRASPAQGSCGTKSYPCRHPGVDVVGRAGTPVRAPETGVIAFTADGGSAPFSGYGPWLVIIRGDSGKYHLLAHLDPNQRTMGPIGMRVKAGQVIGTTSRANHVHWEVRTKMVPAFSQGEDNFTNNADPIAWLSRGSVIGALGALVVVGGGVLLWLAQRNRR